MEPRGELTTFIFFNLYNFLQIYKCNFHYIHRYSPFPLPKKLLFITEEDDYINETRNWQKHRT